MVEVDGICPPRLMIRAIFRALDIDDKADAATQSTARVRRI